jgi:hypothetical protein
MATAKDLVVKPIAAADANRIVRSLHYSGKVVQNSQLHLGVFLDGRCGGAMQFGPCLDKRKIQPLVRGTKWSGFIELNRMAFAEWLPRNSESRCIGYVMRWMRKTYPQIEWVISFADATQCGDGAIYRASSFVLTAIKPNDRLYQLPSGAVAHALNFETTRPTTLQRELRNKHAMPSESADSLLKAEGAKLLGGYQLRYIYFLNPSARDRLTVPVIPFSEIARRGATMYRGKRAGSADSGTPGIQPGGGGATPTPALDGGDA